ncbi:MAG: hypothetical protein JJT89_08860 [Nitriliruptoraceae bacterium]|nr:hypothetical protein [Nitriliruptoraceae bacterium]
MSDMPTDPTMAGGQQMGGQPSEEEMRAYVAQLRGAGLDQILAEVLSSLLNAAQVKIGRRDGRFLLDLVAGLTDQTREVLPEELTSQVDDVLAQLRMAQVQAEPEVAAAAAQGQAEPNDLPATVSPGDAAGASDAPGEAPGQGGADQPPESGPGSAASRLWVPGR